MTLKFIGGASWAVLTADREIHTAGGGASNGVISGNRMILSYEGQNSDIYEIGFADTYHQVIIEDFSLADWSMSNDGDKSIMVSLRFSLTVQSLLLKVVKVSGTDYKLEIVTTDLFGSDDDTAFSGKTDLKWDTTYDAIRIISGGGEVTVELDTGSGFSAADGMSISTALPITECALRTTDHSDSGNSIGYGVVSLVEYGSLSERVGVPSTTWQTPTAEGDLHSDYDVDSGPQHGRVDDWENPDAMGSDIDAASVANEATAKQSYKLGVGGTTSGYTVLGTVFVILHTYQSVGVVEKDGTLSALLADSVTTDELLILALSFSESDILVRGIAQTAPDLGAWTTGDFTNLEAMVKGTNGTDGAINVEVNAVGLEIFDFPADSPPAVGGSSWVIII